MLSRQERPQNVEETFDDQNPVSHCVPTPEDNQNDIPPSVPACILPQTTPPITPTNTPHFPPTESLPVEMENRSSQKELVNSKLQIPQVSQSGVEVKIILDIFILHRV